MKSQANLEKSLYGCIIRGWAIMIASTLSVLVLHILFLRIDTVEIRGGHGYLKLPVNKEFNKIVAVVGR